MAESGEHLCFHGVLLFMLILNRNFVFMLSLCIQLYVHAQITILFHSKMTGTNFFPPLSTMFWEKKVSGKRKFRAFDNVNTLVLMYTFTLSKSLRLLLFSFRSTFRSVGEV